MTDSNSDAPESSALKDRWARILGSRPRADTLPRLALDQYCDLLARLPMPIDDQIEAFVDYVCYAENWCKVLPDQAPGEKFYFFLDPQAGRDRVLGFEGRTYFSSRTELSSPVAGLERPWYATDEYRNRFGYLAYACAAGDEVFTWVDYNPTGLPGDEEIFLLDNNRREALIWADEHQACQLPLDVIATASLRFNRVHASHPDDTAEHARLRAEMIAAITRLRALLSPQVGFRFYQGKVGLFREDDRFYLVRAKCDHLQAERVKVAIEPLDRTIPGHVTPSDSLFRNDDHALWEAVNGGWSIYFDPCLVAAALRVMNMPYFEANAKSRMLAFRSLMLAATNDESRKRVGACPFASPVGNVRTSQQDLEVSIALELGREGRKLRGAEDNLDSAILIMRAAVDLGGPILGEVQDIAVFRNDLGLLLRLKGEYREAVSWFTAAHEYFSRHHPISHPDFTTTLHNLGATQVLIGLEQEGEVALREALSLHERFGATPKLDWSNTCWLLANAIMRDGNREQSNHLSVAAEAVSLYQQALQLRYDEGLEWSGEMAEINLELARVLRDSGASYRAEVFYERALYGYGWARGRDHYKTKEVRDELVRFWNATNRKSRLLF